MHNEAVEHVDMRVIAFFLGSFFCSIRWISAFTLEDFWLFFGWIFASYFFLFGFTFFELDGLLLLMRIDKGSGLGFYSHPCTFSWIAGSGTMKWS